MPKQTLLRLVRDVENPEPDRRKKSVLHQPIIPAGTVLILKEWDESIATGIEECPEVVKGFRHISVARESARHWSDHHEWRGKSALLEALLAAAEPVVVSHAQWLEQEEVWKGEVLIALLEKGIVTREQVATIMRELTEN